MNEFFALIMRFLVRLRAHKLLGMDLTMCVYPLIITEWAMRLLYVILCLLANTLSTPGVHQVHTISTTVNVYFALIRILYFYIPIASHLTQQRTFLSRQPKIN